MVQKVWLMTGIARGLGHALAKAVLARGDLVIGTTRRGEQPVGLAVDNLTVLPLEMTDRDQIARTVAAAFARHDRLDVIVNNAGYGLLGSIEASTPDEADHVFAVNFFGPLALIRAALPRLREQRRGHIVNISSIAGVAPVPGAGLYAATKSALEGLLYSLAQEVAPFGIWVVAPSRQEAGCINYDLRRSDADPDIWCVYENWRSADDLATHFTLPHMQAFIAAVPTLVEGELDLRRFSMISLPAPQDA
jgi:NAD(P)-dependent dehydrogenase (short-subunit alcohol dehydrogenase family)